MLLLGSVLIPVVVLLGPAKTAEAPPPKVETAPETSVRVLGAGEQAYQALTIPDGRRTFPRELTRLVVIRNGVVALDRGLRDERTVAPRGGDPRGPLEEEGLSEEAKVSSDVKSAVIVSTRFRHFLDASAQPGGADAEPVIPTGVEITWIDATREDATWTLPVEGTRWVKSALPISGGRGVVLTTSAELNGPADLRYYGNDGKQRYWMAATEASVVSISSPPLGAFLAVDLAFPEKEGTPNRGVMVLDLLHGSQWTYKWSYGDDAEPLEWHVDDTGVLEVRLPENLVRFDRTGKQLRGKRKS